MFTDYSQLNSYDRYLQQPFFIINEAKMRGKLPPDGSFPYIVQQLKFIGCL
jgi:hypothetical protein